MYAGPWEQVRDPSLGLLGAADVEQQRVHLRQHLLHLARRQVAAVASVPQVPEREGREACRGGGSAVEQATESGGGY